MNLLELAEPQFQQGLSQPRVLDIVGLISKPRIWTFFRKALFYMAGFSVAMRTFCHNDVPLRQS